MKVWVLVSVRDVSSSPEADVSVFASREQALAALNCETGHRFTSYEEYEEYAADAHATYGRHYVTVFGTEFKSVAETDHWYIDSADIVD